MFGQQRPVSVRSVSCADGTRALRILLLAVVGISLLAAAPAAAQETNPICQEETESLSTMIEGFVQLTTGLGIMGLLVVWQADSLMEMFTLSREQKTALKQHKRGALKSAGILVLLGPLFTLAGSTMGLPIAECVNLIPF
jgi:hypothetical protein